jgi:hypothetical protein
MYRDKENIDIEERVVMAGVACSQMTRWGQHGNLRPLSKEAKVVIIERKGNKYEEDERIKKKKIN